MTPSLHPVVGHEDARRALARAHLAGALPAALLLHGLRGVGKQRLALWLAQLQLCEAPTEDKGPCDQCRPCRLALTLEHPDVHWYFPLPRPKGVSGDRLADALESARIEALAELRAQPLRASHSDEVRGLYLGLVQNLRRRALTQPTMAPVQTFLIADAEYLVPQEASPEAANAILKLLEEPPRATCLILTSSEPGRLLPTIRSRSVPLHLSPLPEEDVAAFLQSAAEVPQDNARWAAGLSQGSIGAAMGFLSDGEDLGPLEAIRRQAFRLVEAALSEGYAAGFTAALGFAPAGARSLIPLFDAVEGWLRDLAAVASGAEDSVLSRDAVAPLRKMASDAAVSAGGIAAVLPVLEEARELARGNVNPQLIVSGLLRRLRRALRPSRSRTETVSQ